MTIAYANSRIEITGAETWETLYTWLVANPTYAVSVGITAFEPAAVVYVNDNSSLTVTSRTIRLNTAVQTADLYSPIRANNNNPTTRGRLVLRAGARIELYGSRVVYAEQWPSPDYEDSSVVYFREYSTVQSAFWSSNGNVRLVRFEAVLHTVGATVGNVDQHIGRGTGATAEMTRLRVRANGGGLLLRIADSDGLELVGGLSVSGDFDATQVAPTIHRNTVFQGAVARITVPAGLRRGIRSYVFYNPTSNGTTRLWGFRWNTVSAAATAAVASLVAIVWKLAPTLLASDGLAVQGARWYVAGEAGSPFTEIRSGLTGSTGKVVPADGGAFTWGGNNGAPSSRTFTETDAAFILKSRTPANQLVVGLDNLVIASFRLAYRKYGHRPVEINGHTGDVDVTGSTVLLADSACTLSEAAAAAVVGVNVNWSARTIVVSGVVTLTDLYCHLSHQYAQLAKMPEIADFSAAGARVKLIGWSVSVTGTLSGGALNELEADDVTSTGVLVNLATVVGGIATAYVTISAPALIAGSRVQVYDLTSSTELYNGVLAAQGLLLPVTWSADHTLRLRAEHADMLALETVAVLSSAGATVLDVQQADTVYLTNAIDGSTCTEFVADGANVQVDISDPDGVTSVQRLYAWAQWYQTTAAGIASGFFGAVEALDSASYLIDQAKADIKLDNVGAMPVRVVGGYLSRRDGSTVIAATSGSIQMDPGKAYAAGVDGLARESTVQAVLAVSLG